MIPFPLAQRLKCLGIFVLSLAVFSPLWLSSLAIGIALDEPAGPVPVYLRVDKLDPDDRFAFDWSGLDTAGNPTDVNLTVYRVFSVPADPAAEPERMVQTFPGTVLPGTTSHLVHEVLVSVPPGKYRLGVQFRDTARRWGPFSKDLLIEVAIGPPPDPNDPPSAPAGPSAPTALRFEVGSMP